MERFGKKGQRKRKRKRRKKARTTPRLELFYKLKKKEKVPVACTYLVYEDMRYE